MKITNRFFLFLLLSTLIVTGCLEEEKKSTPPKQKVDKTEMFQTFRDLDYSNALAKAKKENKVVMIDFFTSDCYYCKKMDKETFTQQKVQDFLAKKTISIKLDGRQEYQLARKFGVPGYPTFVFLDSEGTMVGKIIGYRPADTFLKEASRFLF